MTHKIKDIAAALGAAAFGDTDLTIARVAEPAQAGADDLALATNQAYADALAEGNARAALLWPGADWQALGLAAAIIPDRPRYAMSGLTAMMDAGQGFEEGIHPTAVVADDAKIGAGVSIGPMAVVMPGAKIGAGSVIGPQSFIGTQAELGDFCFLREQVSIGARVRIGDRFIAQPGTRIGGDGFSFVTPEPSGVEAARASLGEAGTETAQPWARIHSLGAVQIGDDVEIGANSTVDCGTIRDTQIGSGTKLDNLVQIGHNVIIGRDCLICAQAGVAGSTRIGNNVVLGGKTGVSDNIFIGDRVITGGGTIVLSNLPEGRVVLGYPAVKMEQQIEMNKAARRLPRLFRDVAALKSAVFKSDASD
ncbi:UDP-3-O-(3-hydroxymyristoyl)glucosamine N-acyltransferase [Aliishimia ponticola]|uniref:UDP-3-O-acylglucosamine N-acyltransferase n=1 Tax=Aliishimia ponticola TaxID=2499833 RepID=A0A4S4NIJ4_9RHOB|nr:UDP-3-O-(3-hydroxymyristoyl)glucosamine N-acyltransferase [Aliishimia ponticola]THH38547.1 UDP-3-O-(3-hydroxymyristoyl)glucosamine N-acyltransferase [Aliishimia ponticola]